jgi:hypothetical protein
MTGQERTQRIRQLVLDWLRSGTDEPVQSLFADHAELMPELSLEYEKMVQIRRARQTAPTLIADDSTEFGSENSAPDGPSDHDSSLEVEIPDYDLVRCIGQGGFGVVWLARHQLHGEFRAVKIVQRQQSVELEGVRAYILQARQHPGLVPIEHLGTVANACYYVMPLADDVKGVAALRSAELYEAKTAQWCVDNQAPLPATDVKHLAADVLEGLDHLHRSGLSHCDVKPGNILQFDNRWKLADPGLLVRNDRSQSNRGTVAFWPPEGPQGPAADLYGLGRTLYLLVGPGDFSGFDDYVAGRVELAGKPDRQVQTVIATACALDPANRFTTAVSMQDALNRSVRRRVRLSPRAIGSNAATGPHANKRKPSRNAVRLMGILGIVLLCLLAGIWLQKSPYFLQVFSGAVRVEWLQVAVLRGAEELPVTNGPLAIQDGDQLRVAVEFDEPHHCVVLTLLPDGRMEQHWPQPGSSNQPARRVQRTVLLPHMALNRDRSQLFGVIVLQVSHPVPATHWAQVAAQWKWQPIESDVAWLYDGGRRIAQFSKADSRWPADLGRVAPLKLTTSLLALRRQSPVTELQALLFPVTAPSEVVDSSQSEP